jgi:hypothetical protein
MPDLTEYVKNKARIAEEISVTTISGVPLQDLRDGLDRMKGGRIPILGCLCVHGVHDSPEHPCPCKDLIVWLPIDGIIGWGPSRRRSASGQEIFDFQVAPSTRVIVEQQLPMQASAFSRTIPKVVKSAAPPPFAWVSAAFGVGLAIGRKLDDAFGSNEGGNDNVSDDWADILLDKIGPAPDWLQDIF